jgi:GNAT superfamily N-acetyltransferase
MMRELENYTIQPVNADETREACEVITQSWKSAYRGIIDQDYLDSLTSDLWLKEEAPGRFVALKLAERIIGVSCYGRSRIEEFPDDGELMSLYVLPKFIGAGYGHPLLKYAETALAQDGYTNLALNVFTDNTSAIRFYTDHNWQATRNDKHIEIGGTNYPYLIMRKSLSRPVPHGSAR